MGVPPHLEVQPLSSSQRTLIATHGAVARMRRRRHTGQSTSTTRGSGQGRIYANPLGPRPQGGRAQRWPSLLERLQSRPKARLGTVLTAQLWRHPQARTGKPFLPHGPSSPGDYSSLKGPIPSARTQPDEVWSRGIPSPVHGWSPGSSPTIPPPSPLEGPPPRREGHTGSWAALMRGLLFRRAELWTSVMDPPSDSPGGTTPLHHSLQATQKPILGHEAGHWS